MKCYPIIFRKPDSLDIQYILFDISKITLFIKRCANINGGELAQNWIRKGD